MTPRYFYIDREGVTWIFKSIRPSDMPGFIVGETICGKRRHLHESDVKEMPEKKGEK